MKVIVAIVKDSDAIEVSEALVEQDFRTTRIASTGGFLRRGNVTFLIGVDESAIQTVFRLIEEHCSPPEHPGEHKATAFVLPAEEFVQLG
jgi:uncharacterized protein YaaQ